MKIFKEEGWENFTITPEMREEMRQACKPNFPDILIQQSKHYYENEVDRTPKEQWADALEDLEFSSPEEFRCLKIYYLRKIKLKDWSVILKLFNEVTPRQGQRYCNDGEQIALRLELPMPKPKPKPKPKK